MNHSAIDEREALRAIDAIASGCGRTWLAEQTSSGEAVTAKAIQKLREEYGPAVAGWLVEFAAAHAKAVDKFGEGRWLASQRSVQQATDRWSAAYKAARFPQREAIVDLCCGIGGDAMALMRRGRTLAVDVDPLVARMAAANLDQASKRTPSPVSGDPPEFAGDAEPAPVERSPTACDAVVIASDAGRLLPFPSDYWVHIDPDRRPDDRRTVDPSRFRPSLMIVQQALSGARGAAVKLAPATQVPAEWEGRCEREWISVRGSVRQQVAWFGECRQSNSDGRAPSATSRSKGGLRRATRLGTDGSVSSFAVSGERLSEPMAPTDRVGRYIADLDPAVRAAGLSSELSRTVGMRAIGSPAGFFSGDHSDEPHPLVQSYEVLWSGTAKMKAIEAAVAKMGVKIEAVKVRGAPFRPEQIEKKIRKVCDSSAFCRAVLLLGTAGKRPYAVIGKAR